jgi:hypothetical protein
MVFNRYSIGNALRNNNTNPFLNLILHFIKILLKLCISPSIMSEHIDSIKAFLTIELNLFYVCLLGIWSLEAYIAVWIIRFRYE